MIENKWDNRDNELEYAILSEIERSAEPVGASTLASLVDSSQATIGRKLRNLERRKILVKLSNKGRLLTETGRIYLARLRDSLENVETIKRLLDESSQEAPQKLIDILAVRRVLERETVILATRNISAAELAELEQVLHIQAEKVSCGELGDEEDLYFHRSLARISRNTVLEQIITLVLTQNRVYSGFSYIRKHRPSSVVTDHRQLLQAIRAGEAEKAGDLMVRHIDNILEDVNRYFKSQKKQKP